MARVILSNVWSIYRTKTGKLPPTHTARLRKFMADGMIPSAKRGPRDWTMEESAIPQLGDLVPKLLDAAERRMRHLPPVDAEEPVA
jgi:hypothetical protein